jgi:hypothetical protein
LRNVRKKKEHPLDLGAFLGAGSGSTDGQTDGLGNLVVGYNANAGGHERTGSHNLIGAEHDQRTLGRRVRDHQCRERKRRHRDQGLPQNTTSGIASAVSGGAQNAASGTTPPP